MILSFMEGFSFTVSSQTSGSFSNILNFADSLEDVIALMSEAFQNPDYAKVAKGALSALRREHPEWMVSAEWPSMVKAVDFLDDYLQSKTSKLADTVLNEKVEARFKQFVNLVMKKCKATTDSISSPV